MRKQGFVRLQTCWALAACLLGIIQAIAAAQKPAPSAVVPALRILAEDAYQQRAGVRHWLLRELDGCVWAVRFHVNIVHFDDQLGGRIRLALGDKFLELGVVTDRGVTLVALFL